MCHHTHLSTIGLIVDELRFFMNELYLASISGVKQL